MMKRSSDGASPARPSPSSHPSRPLDARQQEIQSLFPLGVHFSAKPIASIGTSSLEEYWARRCTSESWWTLRSQASSSSRFACLARSHRSAYAYITSSPVARRGEPPKRPHFSRSGLVPRPHIPEALPKKSQKTPSLNFTVADKGKISYRIGDFGAQYMLRIWHRADS